MLTLSLPAFQSLLLVVVSAIAHYEMVGQMIDVMKRKNLFDKNASGVFVFLGFVGFFWLFFSFLFCFGFGFWWFFVWFGLVFVFVLRWMNSSKGYHRNSHSTKQKEMGVYKVKLRFHTIVYDMQAGAVCKGIWWICEYNLLTNK